MKDRAQRAAGAVSPPVQISEDEYLAHYADQRYEWVRGELIEMPPIGLDHSRLWLYLINLLSHYLAHRPIGELLAEPFVLHMPALLANREPDIMIVLHDGVGQLTNTAVVGAADICIEIVSPESASRDYGDKFIEYEEAGVREYWILDPQRKRALFNRRNAEGIYAVQPLPDPPVYRTQLLPDFELSIASLWQDPLPNAAETAEAVRRMLKLEG